MSFVARTHPQQGSDDTVDDRETSWEDWNPIHERFRFTVDAAAAPHNAKLPKYWTKETCGLTQPWQNERVWCNPPYSTIKPWVEKAWTEWAIGGCELIVMLVPSNRTEQAWWQDLVEPRRDTIGSPLSAEFLRGRMRFKAATDAKIPPNSRPPFGSCLLVWSEHAPVRPDMIQQIGIPWTDGRS